LTIGTAAVRQLTWPRVVTRRLTTTKCHSDPRSPRFTAKLHAEPARKVAGGHRPLGWSRVPSSVSVVETREARLPLPEVRFRIVGPAHFDKILDGTYPDPSASASSRSSRCMSVISEPALGQRRSCCAGSADPGRERTSCRRSTCENRPPRGYTFRRRARSSLTTGACSP